MCTWVFSIVGLYVWEMSYFLVSFMVDAVVNGPYVFHVYLSIQYCCSVRLYVWEMSYFLVSFMVDAVVNGPYVQYVIVLLLDYMCEKCQTWWQFLLSFIVDAIVNDLCVQELLKVVYTEPSHTFLCDVNYNPGKCTSPPCLYLSLCLSLSLSLSLCLSHLQVHVYMYLQRRGGGAVWSRHWTWDQEVVGLNHIWVSSTPSDSIVLAQSFRWEIPPPPPSLLCLCATGVLQRGVPRPSVCG